MTTEANNVFPPPDQKPVNPTPLGSTGAFVPPPDQPPASHVPFAPTTTVEPEPKAVAAKAEPKIDHLAEIEQLVASLHNVSPSGAETIRDQILERIGAIRDPKAWDAKVAAA